MCSRVLKSVNLVFALACVVLLPLALVAQDAAKPAAKTSAADSPSRWDIFAGYSYLAPKGEVQVLQSDGTTVPVSFKASNWGMIASGAYYFNNYIGGQVEVAEHDLTVNSTSSNSGIFTAAGGLIARFPTEDLTPFVHALVGSPRMGGPEHEPYTWGVALTAGGGVDYNTPLFNHRLAIRVFQADFEYLHANWGPGVWRGRANLDSPRLSTGLVLHVGSIAPPPPVTLACSASPTSVFPGEPVTLTATAGQLDPKLNAIYSWEGAGVTGSGATATVATASLAPGSYTVKCGIKEGKPGKEGLKPWQSAEGSAPFTVKAFEPPTVSCSANPTTIKPGETSTITAQGTSPQNRPLTYAYTAAAGTVSGSGATGTFSSTGAPTGSTAITCTVSDDKGQTATANTSVTITAPYVAPIPHTQALCSITFENDKKRPVRVDNEAKACLDEVALDLQKQSDAKIVVVGDSTSTEKTPKKGHKHAKVQDLAAARAVNTKDYLVTEKGIDASRISAATGTTDGKKVENYLVPSGATFSSDVAGTTPVDETVVKPQARKALPAKHAAKHAKKAAK
jgi:outer membrane protein OmpA-like peptidoglycan-associated protein